MLSFALNYYFAGGYQYFAFKLTNVVIQIACAWLLFIFSMQLLRLPSTQRTNKLNDKAIPLIAFSIAMLWTAHPINLTSVLYIVQRMTSLSTLFTLATLIFYVKVRSAPFNTNPVKNLFTYVVSFICFLLAIFSKENALLIPAYLVLMEWAFFADKKPWLFCSVLSIRTKNLTYAALALCTFTILILAIEYASRGYGNRTFTLVERVLTESRVITLYLSLIVLPRINAFGLFHDDIQLSTSLVEPWTTLLSIIFIVCLVALAIRWRTSKPLVSFGILFFFTAHLLESTIFGLEIAHEHRNHLASTGIIIAIVGFFIHQQSFNKRIYTIAACGFFIVLGATTMFRAYQWQNDYTLASYEASHHPESPATLALLSNTAYKYQEYGVAEKAINTARTLLPTESSYAINSLVIAVLLEKPIKVTLINEINTKLKNNPFSTSTQISIAHISTHLSKSEFEPLRPYFVTWLEIILEKLGDSQQASIYQYFLAKAYLITGDTLGSINAHQQAFHLNKEFLNPLFETGNIFLALQQPSNARIVLNQIEEANANPSLKINYNRHINELKLAIQKIENGSPISSAE
jgi:tetratricopeptide (TPR) repeat protein